VDVVWAFAPLQLPADIQTLMSWCKNTPGCSAESNDIVTDIDCKNVLVEKIGYTRKPVLADTLICSKNLCPWIVTDMRI
jgi:leucyl aminopeptidase